jgi:hypothetical protein
MEQKMQVNLLELGAKAQSKSEMYKILVNEGDIYLPPYKECSIRFIADIFQEKKKVQSSFFSLYFHLPLGA